MPNDNNNIIELVDDDPTVELQMPVPAPGGNDLGEADANTFDASEDADRELPPGVTVSELEFDLQSRKKTISQLQYDIQQLHTKWLGLETEIGARESQTRQLNADIDSLRENAARKDNLLQKRDRSIKALKAEIRQRDADFRQLESRYDNLQLTHVEQPPTNLDSSQEVGNEKFANDVTRLKRQLQHSENYADTLRQQSQDLIETNTRFERELENLSQSLADAKHRNVRLSSESDLMTARLEEMQSKLDASQEEHKNEMRMLRFELGEAQDTVVQSDEMNSQLASDLVDARSFKEELERMLEESEENSAARIEALQKENAKLTRKSESLEQKLATKSEAISILLAELAKKSEHIESIGEIEDVIHDIDERMSERVQGNDANDKRATVERITRVLVGKVDNQMLRFPLFKNRLTIGRTKDNDIQLKAAYISRHHAVIETHDEQTYIADSGSKNGVQVNAERIDKKVLVHGDIVMIGNARFQYEERKKRDST